MRLVTARAARGDFTLTTSATRGGATGTMASVIAPMASKRGERLPRPGEPSCPLRKLLLVRGPTECEVRAAADDDAAEERMTTPSAPRYSIALLASALSAASAAGRGECERDFCT